MEKTSSSMTTTNRSTIPVLGPDQLPLTFLRYPSITHCSRRQRRAPNLLLHSPVSTLAAGILYRRRNVGANLYGPGSSIAVFGAFQPNVTAISAEFSIDGKVESSLAIPNQVKGKNVWATHRQLFRYEVTKEADKEHILKLKVTEASESQVRSTFPATAPTSQGCSLTRIRRASPSHSLSTT